MPSVPVAAPNDGSQQRRREIPTSRCLQSSAGRASGCLPQGPRFDHEWGRLFCFQHQESWLRSRTAVQHCLPCGRPVPPSLVERKTFNLVVVGSILTVGGLFVLECALNLPSSPKTTTPMLAPFWDVLRCKTSASIGTRIRIFTLVG